MEKESSISNDQYPEKALLQDLELLFEEGKEKEVHVEEKKKIFLKGKEEGEAIGYERGQHELSTLFPLLSSIARKLLEKKEELILEAKREVLELVFVICEKILRSELSQKERFAKLVESYLSFDSSSFQKESVKVYLSPEDLMILQSHFGEFSYDKKEIEEISFLSDPLLQRGDFRIITKTSLLNCTLARQFEDLRSKLQI